MTPPSAPFAIQTYGVGAAKDGRTIVLLPMTGETAHALGQVCAAMDPWKTYGISAARLSASFSATDGGGFRYQVRVGDQLAGAMMLMSPWLIGPYLQFIAVLPDVQGLGVGSSLLRWMETQARAARQRNIWLCVSAFNAPAIAFYRGHGWEEAAMLPALVSDHADEILMRKRLASNPS